MCTRIVYHGVEQRYLTARSMDWNDNPDAQLWIFPRGMERSSVQGPDGFTWTSRFGSVIASAYGICTTDGMNEAGLTANALWLAESEYPTPTDTRPHMTLAIWAQYFLDNFGTVAEAVEEARKECFIITTLQVPGQDRLATLHLALSDGTGDSAILEYLEGKLTIHHSRDYKVMTNSPPFDQQLAINTYWDGIGGTVMLPGTNRAADRYVRGCFYVDAVPKFADQVNAAAATFSVIRNTSVPFGISTPGQPNISSTWWRSVCDHKERRYYFESVLAPAVLWIDFDTVDFSSDQPSRCLPLGQRMTWLSGGPALESFEIAEPFAFAQ